MFINTLRYVFIQIFKEREEDLKRLSRPLLCTCFRTSIWDETLYKVMLFDFSVRFMIMCIAVNECDLKFVQYNIKHAE